MIYLNQAATTYPKPRRVREAYAAALSAVPETQFRSSFGGAPAQSVFRRCREALGQLMQIRETERIFFTAGATGAMNALLYGLPLKGKQIITTATEHNCVLRPLYNMEKLKNDADFSPAEWSGGYPVCGSRFKTAVAPCDAFGRVLPEEIERLVTPRTGAIIVNHCSNVTGMVQDMKAIGGIARKYRLLFIADVSQSAGCLKVRADDWGVDALVFTGHKSLFGVQGTGGYYIRGKVPLLPYSFGGTGRNSAQIVYGEGTYEYETGTQNGPGIAALLAGVDYILERGQEKIMRKERELMGQLYEGLSSLPFVRLYGSAEQNEGPLLSFTVDGLSAPDIGYILQSGFDIAVRTGLHCAPLIHRHIHTEKWGTVRTGISDFNTEDEIKAFLEAVRRIGESL